VFVPESLKRQNELIRTLQEQLEVTERDLANQKWVMQQFLQSPSWRITAPLRWIFRWLRKSTSKKGQPASEAFISSPSGRAVAAGDVSDQTDPAGTVKELYASQYRLNLQTFLTSSATLDLPVHGDPEVSILIVTFNRAELTFACLRSICENYPERSEVIIVDNASSDATSQLLHRIRGARILRNPENLHFLLAVNQAAKEARAPYLLMLNNDAQLLPGSLRSALETIRSDRQIGAVGGKIVLLDGSLQEAGSMIWRDGSCLGYGRGDNPFSSPYMFRRDVDYCSAAFLLTPRGVWEKEHGFDETFRPAYYEETDYCMRLWQRGLRVVYDPAVVVLHYEFASAVSTASALELQAAHRKIFAAKHASALLRHLDSGLSSILAGRTHPAAGPSVPRRALYIDDRVPHVWLGSGFPRARTVLLALRKFGFFVSIFTLATLDEEWTTVYSDLPRDIEVINEMGASLLEAFLRQRHDYYDAIIVSRPHNMNVFKPILEKSPEWFARTSVIYDAEALFAPRDIGLRAVRGERLSPAEVEKIHTAEVALAAVADCVIAVSEADRAAFQARGIERVHLLGHSLEADPTPSKFEERAGFLFVGVIAEDDSPNGDSLIWFLSEVWPHIRKGLGDRARLTIAGANESGRVRDLAGPEVTLTGTVENISTLYDRARVFVAPTRFAAGMPHKVHEAAARGLPVVGTPVLSTQLEWTDDLQMKVASDAAIFAEKCIALHEDENTWNRIRTNALDAIRVDCSPPSFERHLREILDLEIPHKSKAGRGNPSGIGSIGAG
jgi:GT2 family glycosyltransferase